MATVAGETQVVLAGAVPMLGLLQPASCAGSPPPAASARRCFPTCRRIGEFYPGYDVTIWLGLFAPAATPEPIVTRLRADAC